MDKRMFGLIGVVVFLIVVIGSSVSAFSFDFLFQGLSFLAQEDEHHTVYLESPLNESNTNSDNNSLQFIYNHTGQLTGTVNCTLFLDGTPVNYTTNILAATSKTVYSNTSFSEAQHWWWVNCTNGTDSESSVDDEGNWSFIADYTQPNITFVDPTPDDGNTTAKRWAYINTTISDTGSSDNLTAFIDWNRSLVLWMRFNNETGENSTFFRDWSSWGNNGTNNSNPTYVTGKFGKGMQFDGVDDYVDCGSIQDSAFVDFTIEAWIKPDQLSNYKFIAGKGGSFNLYTNGSNLVAFYQNITSYTEHSVDLDFDTPTSVYAADIDGDGDMDIIGAAAIANDITWWENTDGLGTAWTEHGVDLDFNLATSVYAADIDGDGDIDIMGAAWNDNDITWWENTDGSGTAWTEHGVDLDFDGAESVYAADIDGDGDMDIMGAADAADDITWWENTDGLGTAWTEHGVNLSFDGARSVYAADIDGDGDMDIMGAGGVAGDITWWENTDGSGTAWTEHGVDLDFDGAHSVYAADIDGDGDMDITGAAETANDITWWEQERTSFQHSTSISTDLWTYVALVKDADTTKLYINDIVDSTTISLVLPDSTNSFLIGKMINSKFNGIIDEARIHNRPLTPEEINASYNNGLYRLETNLTSLSDGTYNYTAHVVDTAGNTNSTSLRTITIDTTPPQYTSNITTPQSPQTYTTTLEIQFNITITDTYSTIDTVLLEFNNTNYTTTNTSATYTTNITNIAAGTYNYRWHMNDTLGNTNSTPIMTYTINKAQTIITLLLNSTDSDKTYYTPATINATYTINHNQATPNMYRNTTLLSLAGNTNITTYLTPATYNYTINTSTTQNYTSASASHIATILEYPAPTITDWQNNITDEQSLSITINETQSIYFNITADQDVDYTWRKNTTLTSTNPNYTYTNAQPGACNITVAINNTNGTDSKTWILTVKDIPNINSVQESADPVPVNSVISIEANITDLDGDLSGKYAVIDGAWHEMQPNGADMYLANYTPTEEKVYYYYVYANDTTGLYANQSYTFTAQQGPTITNITVTPSSGNETTNFVISANATDYNSIDKVYAKFTQPSIFQIELTNQTLDIYNTTYNSTTPATYIFYIWANDTLGAFSSTSTYSFTINDTIPPTIYSVETTPTQKNETTIITIEANITDFNISEAYANITGTIRTLTYNGTIYKNTTGAIPHTPGFYNITITAIDASGNNQTDTTNYTVNDTQSPQLNSLTVIPTLGNLNTNFTITPNITDNSAVNAKQANITKPDSTCDILTLTGSNPYTVNTTNTSLLGLYRVSIIANDSAGNTLHSAQYPLGTANFSITGSELPSINELNVTASVNTTQEVTISANVTDDNAVNYVYANITRPDLYIITVTSFTNITDIYSANFTETTIPGFYTVEFTAIDIAGNSSTETSNFTANDTSAPAITLFNTDDTTPGINQQITFTITSSDNDIINRTTGAINITKPDNTSIIIPVTETGSFTQGSPPTTVYVLGNAQYTPDATGNYTATLTITDLADNTVESNTGFEAFDATGPVVDSISISATEGTNITVNITTDEPANYTFTYDAGGGWNYASNSIMRLNHTITLPKYSAGTNIIYYINLTDSYNNAGRYPQAGIRNFTVNGLLEFNQTSIQLNLTEKEPRTIQVTLTNPSSIPINATLNKTRAWTTVPASLHLNPLEMAVINITLTPDDTSTGDWHVNETITAHGSAQSAFFINMTVFHKCGDGECDPGETCSNCVSDCGQCDSGSSGSGSSGGAPFMPVADECENNSGCLQTQTCKDYKCIDLECGYCEYAKDHECKKYKCCKDTDCKEGTCKDHNCVKVKEESNETAVGDIKEYARRTISDARNFILRHRLNKDTSESETVLREAQSAFDKENYEKAIELAQKAKALAETAPLREEEKQPEDKFNWHLALSILLLLTILAVLYVKRDTVRTFIGKYTQTSQWRKLRELEDYLDLVRPIITDMKNEKYEAKLLEIEDMRDEAEKMLKDNSSLVDEQIQLAVDALITLKKEVEGRSAGF